LVLNRTMLELQGARPPREEKTAASPPILRRKACGNHLVACSLDPKAVHPSSDPPAVSPAITRIERQRRLAEEEQGASWAINMDAAG
jgi:hypothetical protein